jgi:proteic killer suppression protein
MPGWKKRLLLRLGVLDDAQSLDDIDLPAFHLHPLKGDRAGEWAIDVSGNYRMTFRPETRAREEEAFEVWDVDLEDYH